MTNDRAAKYQVEEPRSIPPEKTWFEGVSQYIWNKEKSTFCERTGISWGKYLGFYFVYYACLGAFWALCFGVFMTTIKDDYPSLRLLHDANILSTPGLNYMPKPSERKVETPVMSYTLSDASSYSDIVSSIDNFLADVAEDTLYVKDVCAAKTGAQTACSVNTANLGDCDGVSDPSYGYASGAPCVFFRINKVIGWIPTAYASNPDPTNLGGRWSANDIPLYCVEKRKKEDGNPEDGAGTPAYYPPAGIPMGCFPYCGPSVNYTSPVVAVKFNSIHKDKEVRIACTLYAANVNPVFKTKSGMAVFAFNIAS